MGKPIGNGHPLGAFVTTPEIAAAFANGMEYFNTYGGNPVSCEIGLAVLDVIRDERLQERARRVGGLRTAGLPRLAERAPIVGCLHGSACRTKPGQRSCTTRSSIAFGQPLQILGRDGVRAVCATGWVMHARRAPKFPDLPHSSEFETMFPIVVSSS
jgi:hypothetical protein